MTRETWTKKKHKTRGGRQSVVEKKKKEAEIKGKGKKGE